MTLLLYELDIQRNIDLSVEYMPPIYRLLCFQAPLVMASQHGDTLGLIDKYLNYTTTSLGPDMTHLALRYINIIIHAISVIRNQVVSHLRAGLPQCF